MKTFPCGHDRSPENTGTGKYRRRFCKTCGDPAPKRYASMLPKMCRGQNANGTHCRAHANAAGWCRFHDPQKGEK